MARLASATVSVARKFGRLPTSDAAKHRSNCHTEAGQIALAENAAGHHFAGGKQVCRLLAARHLHARILVDLHAEISKRDPWTVRIREEGRRIDFARPVR